MKLYLYREHCVRKGRIYLGDDAEAADTDDAFLWGEGIEKELIAQAVERLGRREDTRAGGAGDSFAWKCALHVLEHLGGPDVDYDEERRASWLSRKRPTDCKVETTG
ncbi:MAG TPA: hypothetical protein VM223_00970 [Planctomycetota bacterium]|nr:hypothetical protein [Planctomycetota bacterium]